MAFERDDHFASLGIPFFVSQLRDTQVLRSKKCKHWTGIIGWEIHHNIKVAARAARAARWWWVYFRYGSVQQIMLVDCQNLTHPRELRLFWYNETEQNTSWYFWHKTSLSLDLQGEPYTEMLFDIVLVSPPIYWVAIEIGSFHSHHADSYGSLFSALGPSPAFGKKCPLFVLFCFGILRRTLSAISPNAESLPQRKCFLAAFFCLETYDPCDLSLIKQNFFQILTVAVEVLLITMRNFCCSHGRQTPSLAKHLCWEKVSSKSGFLAEEKHQCWIMLNVDMQTADWSNYKVLPCPDLDSSR